MSDNTGIQTEINELKTTAESMQELYNSFSAAANQLTGSLNKEFEYTRFLQSEIDKKKYHLDYLALKKNLADDRAQSNVILERINETLDVRLKDIDNREQLFGETMEASLQTLEKKIEEFEKIDQVIEKNLKTFRQDMTSASNSEYKILQDKCRQSWVDCSQKLEEVRNAVLDFLKSCEKQNENLIKSIPEKQTKHNWKDVVICLLSFLCFTGMVLQMIYR